MYSMPLFWVHFPTSLTPDNNGHIHMSEKVTSTRLIIAASLVYFSLKINIKTYLLAVPVRCVF